MPVLCPTALRVDRSYTRDYILIANFVAMLAIPFLLITSLNFRLFKTIKVRCCCLGVGGFSKFDFSS